MKNTANELLYKHELKINRIVSIIYGLLCLFPILIYIMSVLGYYNYPIVMGMVAIGATWVMDILFLLDHNHIGTKNFKIIMLCNNRKLFLCIPVTLIFRLQLFTC